MSGGGSQNTVSQQTLPPQIVPYVTGALQAGQGLYQHGGPQYYPGQQVAPLNPMQQQGISQVGLLGTGTNPASSAAGASEFETSGALLNPNNNPYLQGTYKLASDAADNQIQSMYGTSGSNVINSLPVVSDENNNLATQLYGGAYNQGLQAMTQATAFAPGVEAGQYLPSQELLQTGGGTQQQSQNEINAQMQQYNWNSQLPYNMLSWYSGLLGQNASPFAGMSSTGTMNNNSAMTDIGAGVAGVGALSSLYSSGALSGLMGLLAA